MSRRRRQPLGGRILGDRACFPGSARLKEGQLLLCCSGCRPMLNVLIVIHLLLALAMVGVILLQRSEGGALGIGGGGGVMSGRAAGNLLTRATGILATGFFI